LKSGQFKQLQLVLVHGFSKTYGKAQFIQAGGALIQQLLCPDSVGQVASQSEP